MSYLNEMLEAVASDAAACGIPAPIGGDFNAQPHESSMVQWLLQLGWRDGLDWVAPSVT